MQRQFYQSDPQKVIKELGKESLIKALEYMLLIRNFEVRAVFPFLGDVPNLCDHGITQVPC